MPTVKYLKALYGLGGEPVICGPRQNEKSWEIMASDIGGTDDLVAIYIPSKAGEHEYRGCIGAYLQIGALAGKTVRDYGKKCLNYGWNANQWPVGVPALNWWKIPVSEAPSLKDMMARSGCASDWDRMKAALRNGPIDLRTKFPYLVRALTRHLSSVEGKLIPVNTKLPYTTT